MRHFGIDYEDAEVLADRMILEEMWQNNSYAIKHFYQVEDILFINS